ncbi:DUF6406 domain-containing protein [Streptomyces sp. NPDC007991]|uniref:DUF6406 domain-containing protein n=1 Tax=Streptomyces sp. NPDC007991 TaxID=3364803 RepID=UPI0036E41CDA
MTAEELMVLRGTVARARAGEIGGMSSVPATAELPARVKLAIIPADGDERTEILTEGETFEFGQEVWEVVQINHPNKISWNVTLRRVR